MSELNATTNSMDEGNDHPSPIESPPNGKTELPLGIQVRLGKHPWLMMTTFSIAFAFFAFAVAVLTLNSEAEAETQLKLAVIYSEACSESARENESLEEARQQFVEMIDLLVAQLEKIDSNYGFIDRRARERRASLITDLQQISRKLTNESKDNPKRAIEVARGQLRKAYKRSDGTVPIAISLGSLNTGNTKLSPALVDRLATELDEFEAAIEVFAGHFSTANGTTTRDQRTDWNREDDQKQAVSDGEAVCQESRFAYFLITLEWESRTKDPVAASLLDRFIQLETIALKHCHQLIEQLPEQGDRTLHVKEFTHSIARRLKVGMAYQERDWEALAHELQRPIRESIESLSSVAAAQAS